MSAKDVSRELFQPEKHYTGTRMQQGRVILDSDFNENADLQAEDLRQIVNEVICSKGSPNEGFQIDPDTGVIPLGTTTSSYYDLEIRAGSFYLGGNRYELPENTRYFQQSEWLRQRSDSLQKNFLGDLPPLSSAGITGQSTGVLGFDLVYLRAWEQSVSGTEDREILEDALNGPDTSTRVRRMHRVESIPLQGLAHDCQTAFSKLKERLQKLGIENEANFSHNFDDSDCSLQSSAKLKIGANPAETDTNPCAPAGKEGYLGAENQTLQVRLTGPKSFVWGFNNAAPLYRVKLGADNTITFLDAPRDQASWPLRGQGAELIQWGAELPNGEKVAELQGTVVEITEGYNATDASISVEDPSLAVSGADDYYYLRIWSGGPSQSFTPGTAINLPGTGLRVTFTAPGLAGEYWSVALRSSDADEVVPWALAEEIQQQAGEGLSPMGTKMYFAPLALVKWEVNEDNVVCTEVLDCRERFASLCKAYKGCCTIRVGDGIKSFGEVNNIQEAINLLPETGGKICLLPGRHQGTFSIDRRACVTVEGCGDQSVVANDADRAQVPDGSPAEADPMVLICNSRHIKLKNFHIEAFGRVGIQLQSDDVESLASSIQPRVTRDIEIDGVRVLSDGQTIVEAAAGAETATSGDAIAAAVAGGWLPRSSLLCFSADALRIRNCRFGNTPRLGFDSAVILRGRNIEFTDNRITTETGPGGCVLDQTTGLNNLSAVLEAVNQLGMGGVHVLGGSSDIVISRNRIEHGRGFGVALGHLFAGENANTIATYSTPVHPLGLLTLPPSGTDGFVLNITSSAAVLPQGTGAWIPGLAVSKVEISENTIFNMGMNGIGSAAFHNEAIGVHDAEIRNNRISSVARLENQEPGEEAEYRSASGGIVLEHADGTRIHGNHITEINGPTPVQSETGPILAFARAARCGIFIYRAPHSLTISENYIDEVAFSGSGFIESSLAPSAGIFIVHGSYGEGNLGGVAAGDIQITDNYVQQLYGRALSVGHTRHRGGRVRVENNKFGTARNTIQSTPALGLYNIGKAFGEKTPIDASVVHVVGYDVVVRNNDVHDNEPTRDVGIFVYGEYRSEFAHNTCRRNFRNSGIEIQAIVQGTSAMADHNVFESTSTAVNTYKQFLVLNPPIRVSLLVGARIDQASHTGNAELEQVEPGAHALDVVGTSNSFNHGYYDFVTWGHANNIDHLTGSVASKGLFNRKLLDIGVTATAYVYKFDNDPVQYLWTFGIPQGDPQA